MTETAVLEEPEWWIVEFTNEELCYNNRIQIILARRKYKSYIIDGILSKNRAISIWISEYSKEMDKLWLKNRRDLTIQQIEDILYKNKTPDGYRY